MSGENHPRRRQPQNIQWCLDRIIRRAAGGLHQPLPTLKTKEEDTCEHMVEIIICLCQKCQYNIIIRVKHNNYDVYCFNLFKLSILNIILFVLCLLSSS